MRAEIHNIFCIFKEIELGSMKKFWIDSFNIFLFFIEIAGDLIKILPA